MGCKGLRIENVMVQGHTNGGLGIKFWSRIGVVPRSKSGVQRLELVLWSHNTISANVYGLSLVKAAILVASLVGSILFSFAKNTPPDMMLSFTSCGISMKHFATTWPACLQQKHMPSHPCEFPQSISVPFDTDLCTPCYNIQERMRDEVKGDKG